MQQILAPRQYPDAGEFKMLEAVVADTISAALAIGQSSGQVHGWQVQAWTSESRLLRILYRDALWQQSEWIIDWPFASSTVH